MTLRADGRARCFRTIQYNQEAAAYSSKDAAKLALQKKAQKELADARKTEHLEEEVKFASKEMDKVKKGKAEAAETKAVAEGYLTSTEKVTAVQLLSVAPSGWRGGPDVLNSSYMTP